jgi:hypothetical protein
MSAAVRPRACAASQSVGARMSLAYQRQPWRFFPSGSNARLEMMPWTPGSAPVAIEACAGYVTLGKTERAPSLHAPFFTISRSVGIFKLCASGAV